MKLDPVYLLAPEPDTRVKLSRRAFAGTLIATGAACIAGGFGLGWSAAAKLLDREKANDEERPFHLEWGQSLAIGPLDALVTNAHPYLVVVNSHPDDVRLWRGLGRLADHVTTAPRHEIESSVAIALAHLLRRLDPPIEPRRFVNLRASLEQLVR